MKKTKEKAEETKNKILSCALKLFSEKGFRAAKLSDVAKAAGVTRGAIYWHFKDKNHLFYEILEQNYGIIQDFLENILKKDLPVLEKIKLMFFEMKAHLKNDQEYRAIQKITHYNEEFPQEIKDIIMKYFEKTKKLLDKIEKLIQKGIENREINSEFSSRAVTYSFGILFAAVEHISIFHDELSFLEGDYSDDLMKILFKGLKN